MKLLIVDRDHNLVEMLVGWLKSLGHEVHRAYTWERAKVEWEQHQPDLVILDTARENTRAFRLCRDMRKLHDALVLVMNDCNDVRDEIRCLDEGADAYLHKPFFPGQLLAHIRAVSRGVRSTWSQERSSLITVGPLCIDASHNEVRLFDKVIRLTPTESRLLHLLATNANMVCTHDSIISHVWGFGNDGDTTLIKAHILHLRQKLEPDPAHPHYLLTVPGVGYTLVRQAVEGASSGPENAVSYKSIS